VSVLLEKVNASSELAALPLRSAEFRHVPTVTPALCTPATPGVMCAVAFATGYVVTAAGNA
jgi:hypothetical protein